MILVPPIEPMLAKPLGHTLPSGEGVAFEPKPYSPASMNVREYQLPAGSM